MGSYSCSDVTTEDTAQGLLPSNWSDLTDPLSDMFDWFGDQMEDIYKVVYTALVDAIYAITNDLVDWLGKHLIGHYDTPNFDAYEVGYADGSLDWGVDGDYNGIVGLIGMIHYYTLYFTQNYLATWYGPLIVGIIVAGMIIYFRFGAWIIDHIPIVG